MALNKGAKESTKGVLPEYAYEYDHGYIYTLAGWWQEPEAPPATTAVLDLGKPETQVTGLLLRANVPSTIRLKGPADLLFSAFSVRLTARSLVRNLARPEWGSSRAVSGADADWQEILLAAPARIEAVGVRSKSASADVWVKYREGTDKTYVRALNLYGFTTKGGFRYSGYHQQAVVTQAVKLELPDQQAEVLLSSPSLPSRVALALGDDTPAQLFPAEMELNGTVTSRDLAGQINAAWKRGSSGETAEAQLRITSLTDGVVQVDLSGVWGRYYASPAQSLALDSVHPAVVGVAWPFGATPDGQVSLHLTGKLTGGRRLSSVTGPPAFCVRATERLEVAQAVRIVAAESPTEQRTVQAVWLMLPRLPRAEERLEIRLAAAAGAPPFPADEPLARQKVTLPVDQAAYIPASTGGYWYRAALEKPVSLDGLQATSPLFVVAAGREGGSLLAHQSLGVAPESGERIPAGAWAGVSLARNLDLTGTWEVQSFNRQAARWMVDLELTPVPAETQSLITVAYGPGPPQPLPLSAADRVSVQTARQQVARPQPYTASETSPPVLTATLASPVRADLSVQLFLYKSVMGEP
ncbi:MAG: hypothetical protein ACOY94_07215 [Bacillota bacterium]